MWNDIEKIVGVLAGGRGKRTKTTLGSRKVSSARDLELAVQEGLPSESVEMTIDRIFPHDPTIRYQIVPRATFARRLKKGERLSPTESEKLQRIARVYAMAIDVWGNEEDAREFMAKCHPMLDDRTPFEASLSEIGAREVESILGRLLFGSVA
ncbi:hypothetical protein B7486_51165 [cyanobacterium TDX16]|nr:hypothetical protein B7486_51165 [cyanobacterium TDX16]